EKGKETVLSVLPFFHVYGMTTVMNLSIMIAAKMILLPKFSAKEVLQTIEKQRPTLFPGAPTIYVGLINHPDIEKYDLSSIEACISGSATLPLEVQERFEKLTGGRLVEGYGLTETSPVTHASFVWGGRIKGSMGVPWRDTDAKELKRGPRGEVKIGEVEEISGKGHQVLKGYLGYMDEEGYFYIVDRKKDMIIASSYNIYPREVEEVLYEYDGVQEAVVVGVPDAYRGENVKAYIVPKEGVTLDEEHIKAF